MAIKLLPGVAAVLAVFVLSGCASWFLGGAEMAGQAPPAPVAVFTAPHCVGADGQPIPAPEATYHLAQEPPGWVLYEMEPRGGGARITNSWADATGRHFFVWVRTGPGWQYTFPVDTTQPPVRIVYTAGTYAAAGSEGAAVRPEGTPAATCPLIAMTAGGATAHAPATSGGSQPAPPPAAAARAVPVQPVAAAPVVAARPVVAAPPVVVAPPVVAARPGRSPSASAQPAPSGSPAPPVPQCTGDDPAGGQQAAARGRALYRQAAQAPGGPDMDRMREALAEFDRLCATGDDWALELRASVLFVLGRHVEAIESLDAFLVAHPVRSLPSDVRGRVSGNLPLLEQRVATLRARADVTGAMIRVNGRGWRPLDGAHIRVEPGSAHVEVATNGRTVVDRTETLAAGTTTERTYDLASGARPVAQPASRVSSLDRTEMARLDEETPPGASRSTSSLDDREPPPGANGDGGLDLVPWIVSAAVVAGASFAVAIPLRVVSDDQLNQYNTRGCTRSDPICSQVLDESDMAFNASNGLFIIGGVLAATSVTLGIVQAVLGGASSSPDDGDERSLMCVPGLLGGMCSVTF